MVKSDGDYEASLKAQLADFQASRGCQGNNSDIPRKRRKRFDRGNGKVPDVSVVYKTSVGKIADDLLNYGLCLVDEAERDDYLVSGISDDGEPIVDVSKTFGLLEDILRIGLNGEGEEDNLQQHLLDDLIEYEGGVKDLEFFNYRPVYSDKITPGMVLNRCLNSEYLDDKYSKNFGALSYVLNTVLACGNEKYSGRDVQDILNVLKI